MQVQKTRATADGDRDHGLQARLRFTFADCGSEVRCCVVVKELGAWRVKGRKRKEGGGGEKRRAGDKGPRWLAGLGERTSAGMR